MSERYAPDSGTSRTGLAIIIHGFDGSVGQMDPLRSVVTETLPDADVIVPTMPYGRGLGRFCMRRPEDIVDDLMRRIDRLVEDRERDGGRYSDIYIIGYSLGAVLARRLVVLAFGEQKGPDGVVAAPFDPVHDAHRQRRPWATSIRRLVLLAGMNRGWSVSSTMDWLTTIQWSVGQFIFDAVLRGKPTIMAIRRGAPFLVQTRLQWLALMNTDIGGRPNLMIVQLLGTVDDLVSPDDNVDYSVDLNTSEDVTSYFYVEVPCSGHRTILDMGSDAGTTCKAAGARRSRLALALAGDRGAVEKASVRRDQMRDNLQPAPDTSVTDVVFVMHGIRDNGFWTQKIARTIKLQSDGEAADASASRETRRHFASWTESYGYFAMLPFVLRTTRQRKVEWFMDRYVEARARYPCATFHYVGHSNGTYLAAQALRDYPAVRFERVVFLGSVVRRDYDWMSLIEPRDGSARRVGAVLNYVATADWVVAIFPKGLQPLAMFNLGSAGHDGFLQARIDGPVHEVSYIVGAHGAGHEEPHWHDIARFIVLGRPPEPDYPPFSQYQNSRPQFTDLISTMLLAIGVGVVCGIAVSLASHMLAASTPLEAIEYAAALAGYLMLVSTIVTRF